jgi:hypothetical protein
MMKFLNSIKLTIASLMILFGLGLGIRMVIEIPKQFGGISLSYIALSGNTPVAASFITLYSAVCVLSGSYLLSKIPDSN